MLPGHSQPARYNYGKLLDELGASPEFKRRLLRAFESVRPGHGIRDIALSGARAELSKAGQDLLRKFQLFARRFPTLPGNAVRFIPEFVLLLAAAGRLLFPEDDLEVSLRQTVIRSMQNAPALPPFSEQFRVAAGSPLRFIQFQATNPGHLGNYGHVEVEAESELRFRVLYTNDYPLLSPLFSEPFILGVIRALGREGSTNTTILSSSSFALDIELS